MLHLHSCRKVPRTEVAEDAAGEDQEGSQEEAEVKEELAEVEEEVSEEKVVTGERTGREEA